MSVPVNNVPVAIPPKRRYARQEFVGRQAELNEVARRVAQGQRGDKIDMPVLNFWGLEGSGKSWLILDIVRRYRGSGRSLPAEGKPTCTALFDFERGDLFEWTSAKLAGLLKPVLQDLAAQLADVPPNFSDLLACLEAADASRSAEDWARCFVEWIITLTDSFVPLVLLDTVERVSPDTLAQIERYVIEPLARTDAVVLITAGRREVARWRRFAVRSRQSMPMELRPLNPKDTVIQVHKQGFKVPGEFVYNYSYGLAFASQVIATALCQLSGGHPVDESFIRQHEHALKPWLAALEEHFLRALSPELRAALRALCVLRVIRQDAVVQLLDADEARCRQLLDELETTPMMWWDAECGVYQTPFALRRLLNQSLRFQEPEVFAGQHARAADYYTRAIERNPYDCGPLLIEALYHLTWGYPNQPAKVHALLEWVLRPEHFTVGGVEFLATQVETDDELRMAFAALLDHVLQFVQQLRREVRRLRLSG